MEMSPSAAASEPLLLDHLPFREGQHLAAPVSHESGPPPAATHAASRASTSSTSGTSARAHPPSVTSTHAPHHAVPRPPTPSPSSCRPPIMPTAPLSPTFVQVCFTPAPGEISASSSSAKIGADKHSSSASRRAGLGSVRAALCIFKANIGPGILYLPKACQRGGYVGFTALMLVMGSMSCVATLLLVKVHEELLENWDDLSSSSGEPEGGSSGEPTREGAGEQAAPPDTDLAVPSSSTCGPLSTPTNFSGPPTTTGPRTDLSYGDVLQHLTPHHRTGRLCVNVSTCLLQFGLCTQYFIVVAKLLQSAWLTDWRVFPLMLLVYAVATPMTWINDVTWLAPTNILADVLILGSLALVFSREFLQIAAAAAGDVTMSKSLPPIVPIAGEVAGGGGEQPEQAWSGSASATSVLASVAERSVPVVPGTGARQEGASAATVSSSEQGVDLENYFSSLSPFGPFDEVLVCVGTVCFCFEGICLVLPVAQAVR